MNPTTHKLPRFQVRGDEKGGWCVLDTATGTTFPAKTRGDAERFAATHNGIRGLLTSVYGER